MLYLLAGPVIAVIGIGAVFFILRRKSVEKRSMYSARREQIEHKVRAARQRTLTPHGHTPKPAEAPAAPSPFAPTEVQPMVNYEIPAYQAPAAAAPPVAPPTPPPTAPSPQPAWETPAQPPQDMPWETPGETSPAPPAFDYPAAPPDTFRPAPEATPRTEPSEPVWTPAPRPAEPEVPIEQPVGAASSGAGSWSIVSSAKDSAIAEPASGRKKDEAAGGSGWSLASGEAPGAETDAEGAARRPSGTLVAAAQYAVLVVGLVMVLIGVLVMVANSHVT